MPHRCSTEVVVEVVVDQSTSSMSSKSSPEDMMHEEEPYIGIDLGLLGDRRLDGSPSGAAAVCSDGENISNQPKARPAAKSPMSHSNIDNVDHQWPSDLSFFDMTLAQVSLSGSTTHACINGFLSWLESQDVFINETYRAYFRGRMVQVLFETLSLQKSTYGAEAMYLRCQHALQTLCAPGVRASQEPSWLLSQALVCTDAYVLMEHRSPPRVHQSQPPSKFNVSQRRAVLQSLSHTVHVIQGPPGTGKEPIFYQAPSTHRPIVTSRTVEGNPRRIRETLLT